MRHVVTINVDIPAPPKEIRLKMKLGGLQRLKDVLQRIEKALLRTTDPLELAVTELLLTRLWQAMCDLNPDDYRTIEDYEDDLLTWYSVHDLQKEICDMSIGDLSDLFRKCGLSTR